MLDGDTDREDLPKFLGERSDQGWPPWVVVNDVYRLIYLLGYGRNLGPVLDLA